MAQYWEDWSGSTIGASATGWSLRWATSASNIVEAHSSGPAGRRLRIDRSVNGHSMYSMDAVDGDANRANFKIRALIQAPNTTSTIATLAGVAGRGAGSPSATYYTGSFYQSGSSSSTRSVFARSYVGGAGGTLSVPGSAAIWTVGSLYWLGLEVSGTSVRVTLANAATPETLIVDVSGTSSEISAAGWIGISSATAVTGPYYVYAVGIGTNGDEAPISDPALIPVKGVSLSMGDGATPVTSVSGITVLWWDSTPPTGAPHETTASIDASGTLVVDLDSVTALAIGDYGTIGYTKQGATALEDKGNLHRAQIVDIS